GPRPGSPIFPAPSSYGRSRCRPVTISPLDGQRDGDPRTAVRLALHLDLATERHDEALCHREEEPGAGQRATAPGAHLAKWAENPRLLLRGEAHPVVGHGDGDLAIALEAGRADLSDLSVLD